MFPGPSTKWMPVPKSVSRPSLPASRSKFQDGVSPVRLKKPIPLSPLRKTQSSDDRF